MYKGLSVYFCGKEDCVPGHCFGPALRPHYLIHVIFSGKGIYQCNGKTYHLKAGDSFLIRPMESIFYQADREDPWSYAWAGFDGSECPELLKHTAFKDGLIFSPGEAFDTEGFYHSMDQLVSYFSENPDNRLASAGNLLLVLSHTQKKPSESRADISTLYFQKASEYIRANYAYPIQISNVAAFVGIDRSYLYRIFTEQEGISPKQYLLKCRMQMAAKLLCSSTCTVTEAALSSGFRDAPSFCSYFRQETGYTPKEFRKIYRDSIT